MPIFNPATGAGIHGSLGGTFYTVDTSDFDAAAGVLFELAGYIDNTQIPLQSAKSIARDDMKKRFDTETDPDGRKWKALDPDYKEWKDEEAPGLPILTLYKKGRAEALRTKATAESAFSVSADSVFFSTDNLPDYWSAHQYGDGSDLSFTDNEGKFIQVWNTPPRPFIGLSVEAEQKIEEVFDLWLSEGLGAASKKYAISSHGFLQHRTAKGQYGSRVSTAISSTPAPSIVPISVSDLESDFGL